MGICWFCHWGWPKPIRDIYDEAVELLDGSEDALRWGPSHIVWDDENFDSAQWCLDHFDKYADHERFTEDELRIVRESLTKLLAVPDEFKQPPAEYDDEHPERFPPPSHWVMEPKR